MLRLFALAAVACPLLAGCSRGPDLTPVTGTVTLNGKPLPNVRVEFHPDPDKGTRGDAAAATTDAAGRFALAHPGGGPGAAAGHYRVVLTDLDRSGPAPVGRAARAETPGPRPAAKPNRVPVAYTDLARTPVLQEVKAGMGEVAISVRR